MLNPRPPRKFLRTTDRINFPIEISDQQPGLQVLQVTCHRHHRPNRSITDFIFIICQLISGKHFDRVNTNELLDLLTGSLLVSRIYRNYLLHCVYNK